MRIMLDTGREDAMLEVRDHVLGPPPDKRTNTVIMLSSGGEDS